MAVTKSMTPVEILICTVYISLNDLVVKSEFSLVSSVSSLHLCCLPCMNPFLPNTGQTCGGNCLCFSLLHCRGVGKSFGCWKIIGKSWSCWGVGKSLGSCEVVRELGSQEVGSYWEARKSLRSRGVGKLFGSWELVGELGNWEVGSQVARKLRVGQ